MEAPTPTRPLPDAVRAAGITQARQLDVRPILDKGGDPFALIMKTAQALGPSEALQLMVGFEPIPLYAVLKSMGCAAHTEKDGATFHIWFFKSAVESGQPATPPPDRAPLKPPVQLDVSGLEPPQPMMAILEKLGELGPGAQLLVRHHKEPVLLYDKLKLRGYGARADKRAEGDYLIHIAPAWVFESKATR